MDVVIGIPTLNRADLLERNLRSLMAQMSAFTKIIVIDNGNQNIPYEGKFDKLEVIHNKQNEGVCSSWNRLIAQAFEKEKADWLLVLNDDVALHPNQFNNSINFLFAHHRDKWLLVSPFFWSSWAMSKNGAEHLSYEPHKWFDEQLFPGYYGDNDMHWRVQQLSPERVLFQVSLLTPEICDNSMTLKKAPELRQGIAQSAQYYFSKWGGGPNLETFKTPFNK